LNCSIATYDPKQDPASLPDVLKPSRPQDHLINWSEEDRALFHRVMVRSMKCYPAVAKVTGKKMVDVLAYYYGAYKNTKEYKAFKTKCPKHADEFILCRICNKQRADLTCDLCTDAYHLKCLKPALTQVPGDEVWHCMCCKDDEKRKRKVAVERNYREKTSPPKKNSILESLPNVPTVPTSLATPALSVSPARQEDASHVVDLVFRPTTDSLQGLSHKQSILLGTNNSGIETMAEIKTSGQQSLKRKAAQSSTVLTVLGTKQASKDTGLQENGTLQNKKTMSSESGSSEAKAAAKLGTKTQLLSAEKTVPVKSEAKAKANASQKKQIGDKEQKTKAKQSKPDIKELSDSDSSDDEDEDAAKLGKPEHITKKSELAFFGDVRLKFPSQEENGDSGIPWKIKVGDIVAFHIQDANPPLYYKDADYINAPKAEMGKIWYPFEVPWSPGEVVSITWLPEGVNIRTFRQNMTQKVDPNEKNYYSVKVDLDAVIIEVRWLYRCTEIKQAMQAARPKKYSPAKLTKDKFCSRILTAAHMGMFMDLENRPVDEVWETDHVDEVDLSTAIGPIRLLSSNESLKRSNGPVESPVDHTFKMTPAQLVCRKFYFVHRMKEVEFPKWVGSTRLERGLNLSPKFKKVPAYKTARSKQVIAMDSKQVSKKAIAMEPKKKVMIL
jgi:hypothetical protein